MAFAALVAFSSAALLIAAVTVSAVGLFWATAALERWLDATPKDNPAASSDRTRVRR
jgi:hypothetical protein